MKWKYNTKFDIEKHFGFVYLITDTQTDMKYIGSKQFFNKIKRPPLKGKKRIRRDTKESNWLYYNGSSKALNEVIDQYVINVRNEETTVTRSDHEIILNRFRYKMLSIHDSRFTLSYYENKMIYQHDALLNDQYYNCYTSRLGTKKDFK